MTEAPVLSIPGRPAILAHNGGIIYISVHDAEFLRRKREWRKKFFDSHVDHGGSDPKMRKVLKDYRCWLTQEKEWYAQYRDEHGKPLETPDVAMKAHARAVREVVLGQNRPVLAGDFVRVGGRVGRINHLLSDGKPRTAEEIGQVLGISRSNVVTCISRLRTAGAKIATVSRSAGRGRPVTYQMINPKPITTSMERLVEVLSDGQSHTVEELRAKTGCTANSFYNVLRRLAAQRITLVTERVYGTKNVWYRIALPKAS